MKPKRKRDLYKILFCSSEVYPLIKTGGLADVAGGLPTALHALGHEVIIAMPAYPKAIKSLDRTEILCPLSSGNSQLIQGYLPQTDVKVWLVDIPELFNRDGGPYQNTHGDDWVDNAQRFYEFNRVCCDIAMNRLGIKWKPDVVHCNDWQTGLTPALLSIESNRPAIIFTIHNIAYQGVFPRQTFQSLGIPEEFWSMEKLEYYDQFSFLKGGLVFADFINTVSPTYAKEIRSSQFGFGMEGLLNYRSEALSGILNGVDYSQWNPATDSLIAQNFTPRSIKKKAANKAALQKRFHLALQPDVPLIGTIGRMVEQKGYDLVLAALPDMMQHDLQFVILGSGHKHLEHALVQSSQQYSGKCAVQVGYDEELAHLIEAGADMFLMPSRFEPCGLNQIYSLKYGTVPIVHHTGGLADSVVDTNETSINDGTATGFQFKEATHQSMLAAVERALAYYRSPETWLQIVKNGMKCDFGWPKSAEQYLSLYKKAIQMRSN